MASTDTSLDDSRSEIESLKIQLADLDTARQHIHDWFRKNQHEHHWTGQLSTSALSTATAVSAISLVLKSTKSQDPKLQQLVGGGLKWLEQNQNADGGFGDTELSHSNISTTLLVLAAWNLAEQTGLSLEDQAVEHSEAEAKRESAKQAAWEFVDAQGSWQGLRDRYGKDKTFVVPIMTNCALAGLVEWGQVADLPFEAAALPQSWYRLVRLPVVSYAIPALVAIGQAKHFHKPSRAMPLRWLRSALVDRTMDVLLDMQPESGGYLEAVPLTSFVLMSLAATGRANSPVAQSAIRFIADSVLDDGSWPIDTNLATWVTSLSTRALCKAQLTDSDGSSSTISKVDGLVNQSTISWLLGCQHLQRHPFTGAAPGGWGWTNLSGAVPDADDTPAAMLALLAWAEQQKDNKVAIDLDATGITNAIDYGSRWLLDLQNRDGGWPTFCSGWGTLPFDRSGSDLTAHAIRALGGWWQRAQDWDLVIPSLNTRRVSKAIERGLQYLERTQLTNYWLPLWFGNQDNHDDENPIYGTARVLMAYAECGRSPLLRESTQYHSLDMMHAGLQFFETSQNADGGWGGGVSVYYDKSDKSNHSTSSIEETAQAIEAIATCLPLANREVQTRFAPILNVGVRFLITAVEQSHLERSWPIGFYFAKLWYHEKTYPWVYTLSALNAVHQYCR